MTPSTNTQLKEETQECLTRELDKEYSTQGNNYLEMLSTACMEMMHRYGSEFKSAIEFGCGCGGMTFHLAQHFQKVSNLAQLVTADSCITCTFLGWFLIFPSPFRILHVFRQTKPCTNKKIHTPLTV